MGFDLWWSVANGCKQIIKIQLAHSSEIRAARDTPGDPGTINTSQKKQRSGIERLLQANLCRVEETLRVIEEYGKLYGAEMSADIKQIRYRGLTASTICWLTVISITQAIAPVFSDFPSENLF